VPDFRTKVDPVQVARDNWEAQGWAHGSTAMVVASIMRTQQILLADTEATLQPFGLSATRYEILQVLYFRRDNMLPLGQLSERLQVHPTSITNAVDKLERQGFVERVPHPTDRRTTLAHLTKTGRQVVRQATAALVDVGFAHIGLADDELGQLFELLRKVRHAAGDFRDPALEDGGRAAGMR
jgi:DNA-binding MarR family transcriptional regulator